jgi:hypothetical protein
LELGGRHARQFALSDRIGDQSMRFRSGKSHQTSNDDHQNRTGSKHEFVSSVHFSAMAVWVDQRDFEFTV